MSISLDDFHIQFYRHICWLCWCLQTRYWLPMDWYYRS